MINQHCLSNFFHDLSVSLNFFLMFIIKALRLLVVFNFSTSSGSPDMAGSVSVTGKENIEWDY